MDFALTQESYISGLQSRVFIKNRTLEYTYCNDALARDFEKSSLEVIGTDDFDHFPEAQALNNREEDRHVIETGKSLNHVKKIRSRGRDLWVRVSKEPYCDEQGRIIGVIGLLEDIPFEQSCWGIGFPEGMPGDAESSHTTPFVVWEWEFGTDNFTLSENAAAVLGESVVLNKSRKFHPADIVYEEDREKAVTEVRRAVNDKRFFSMELRIPLNHSLKWFYTTGGVIVSGHDGKPRLYGIARDISAWKIDRRGFNPYRSAYEHSGVPKLFTDKEGHLIHCNSAFMELWRINSSRDIHGTSILNFWVKDGELKRVLDNELADNPSWSGEMKALRADGSVFSAYVILNKLHDDSGRPLNIAATVLDVSEKKALMQELVNTRRDLEETSTALRVVLNKKEEEAADNDECVNRIVQKTVMPLLYQLKLDNNNCNEEIIDQIIWNLQQLQNCSGNMLVEKLSTREHQIARFIVQGLSSKEIAKLMECL